MPLPEINAFVPAIDAETWTLRVHGMVDRELTLDFDDEITAGACVTRREEVPA